MTLKKSDVTYLIYTFLFVCLGLFGAHHFYHRRWLRGMPYLVLFLINQFLPWPTDPSPVVGALWLLFNSSLFVAWALLLCYDMVQLLQSRVTSPQGECLTTACRWFKWLPLLALGFIVPLAWLNATSMMTAIWFLSTHWFM